MAKGTLASFATTRKSASSVASGKAKAGLTGSTATKKAGTTTAAPTAGQNTSSSKKAKVEQSVLPSSEGDDVVQVNRDGTARRKLKPNDRKYQKLYGEYMEENLGEFPLRESGRNVRAMQRRLTWRCDAIVHGDDHSKVDFILRQFDLAPE